MTKQQLTIRVNWSWKKNYQYTNSS